jgi:hypothetical protein
MCYDINVVLCMYHFSVTRIDLLFSLVLLQKAQIGCPTCDDFLRYSMLAQICLYDTKLRNYSTQALGTSPGGHWGVTTRVICAITTRRELADIILSALDTTTG